MLVIANTTPLIVLARRGLFDVLHALYGTVVLPPAVYREVVTEAEGRAGGQETVAAIRAGWIEIRALSTPETAQQLRTAFLLGDGESEVLALAQEHRAGLVLIDEERGVRRAAVLGLPVLRTVGILLQAKTRGLLPTVQEHLAALRAEGFRLSEAAYHEALRQAGEAP